MPKNTLFYLAVILLLLGGPFFIHRGLVSGTPPVIAKQTLNGEAVFPVKGPAIIYFWAEWCGICKMMQESVDSLLQQYPGITVAVKSGDDDEVSAYLRQHRLRWPVVNDSEGTIAKQYGVKGVPVAFFVDRQGEILFSSVGYSSGYGLRFRLWLAELF